MRFASIQACLQMQGAVVRLPAVLGLQPRRLSTASNMQHTAMPNAAYTRFHGGSIL